MPLLKKDSALAFFDFLPELSQYEGRENQIARLNRRFEFLIAPFSKEISGARVLDLGAHDGRWAYAFAGAGAANVTAIEARAEVAARFQTFPDPSLKARVTMCIQDVFVGLEAAIAAKEQYDVIAIFGLLYHVMDHFRLLDLVRQPGPKLIIIDGDFVKQQGAIIRLVRERTDNILNAVPQIDGQSIAVKGIPSRAALEMMAQGLGYDVVWSNWDLLPPDQRSGVKDYYLSPDRSLRRATCVLRPQVL
jgi:hypothetical protein